MNLSQYVGLPYVERGCWELLRLVYAEQLGITLPAYAKEYAAIPDEERAELGRLITQSRSDWYAIAPGDERAGDAVLFKIFGEPVHIGVIVERGLFLHVQQGRTSCVESYLGAKWRPRLEGVYRHASA